MCQRDVRQSSLQTYYVTIASSQQATISPAEIVSPSGRFLNLKPIMLKICQIALPTQKSQYIRICYMDW